MKKIYSILLSTLIGAQIANAQCSPVANNFEIKLIQNSQNTLQLQMRYHADAVENAKSILPTTQQLFDGMIVAISWPTTSQLQLTKVVNSNPNFDLILDNTDSKFNKTAVDNIKTLFHNNITTAPKAFDANWKNDVWMDIATISFNGKLTKGDYISLVNCDYGLAHPNSFHGNSTTDPWLSLLDDAGNNLQYSPKMITELPSIFDNNITVYPVPTTGELNIDVDCTITTSAVVKITDMNGRLMKTILFDLEKGKNSNKIDIGELSAGNYNIQLTDGKALNFTKKITKI